MSAIMQAYDDGVLDRAVHSRLVQNLPGFAARAGIQDIYILQKISAHGCTDVDIGYVRTIKRAAASGVYGMRYVGAQTVPVLPRMLAVAGACIRNFVEAR